MSFKTPFHICIYSILVHWLMFFSLLPVHSYAQSKHFPQIQHFVGYEAQYLSPNPKLPKFFSKIHEDWYQMLQKYDPQVYNSPNTIMNKKYAHTWNSTYKKLQKAQKIDLLRGINGFINKVPSKDDHKLYGQEEYWATPKEFFTNHGGDCEDYAFAKYFALKYFQWPEQDLWVLLVFDKVHKMLHAVLTARLDEKLYILDNLAKPRHKLLHEKEYQNKILPLFALSAKGVWIFKEGVKEHVKNNAASTKKKEPS